MSADGCRTEPPMRCRNGSICMDAIAVDTVAAQPSRRAATHRRIGSPESRLTGAVDGRVTTWAR